MNWKDKAIDLVIVIIGISIALGMQDWYEGKRNAALEQQYLGTIMEDITIDLKELQDDLDFTKEQYENIKIVLGIIQTQDRNKVDSILHYTIHFGNFTEFKPSSTTYESLVQSGDMNIIRNYRLKEQLGKLHLRYYGVVNTVEYVYIDAYLELWNFLKVNFNYMTKEITNPNDFYETKFTNLMFSLESAARQKIVHYKNAIENADKVKEHLEKAVEFN